MAVELADIVTRHGEQFCERFGQRVLPSHRRALRDIATCRTPARGGHLYACDACGATRYSYHSCKNRHCPKCQNADTSRWIEVQRDRLLPVPYFLVTFTLPGELRAIVFSHQRLLYGLLFRGAAAAMQALADDPRHLGARLGMLAVLHTWTRELRFHPHVHLLVPAGGVSGDGKRWIAARSPAFLLPVRALSIVFRAKLRDALRAVGLFEQVPASIWEKRWVVHAKPVGRGETVLRYLAPYVYRIAISNRRIVGLRQGRVTFTARCPNSGRSVAHTITAMDFLWRFMQHVLPRRFVRVRAYGFLASRVRTPIDAVRRLIGPADATNSVGPDHHEQPPSTNASTTSMRCPACGEPMRLVEVLARCAHASFQQPLAQGRGPP